MKSAVELPCPFAGTVVELLVAEGAAVEVGTPLIRVATSAPGDPVQVLVGYGPPPRVKARRRRRRPGAPSPRHRQDLGQVESGVQGGVGEGRDVADPRAGEG
ncbi:biotin/lipoyl-containing protein [Saccharopolyspora sp. NPDC000359]|uniref:biotin/lipoyl-containing protein n=1 Tax=Saccharopolyspora sp. NPDC000359 TaxID=3154251 RepID=UPI00331ED39B